MTRKQFWRYTRGLAAPVLLWGLVVFSLIAPLRAWLTGHEKYDEEAMREWIKEARVFRETLPELTADYQKQLAAYQEVARAQANGSGTAPPSEALDAARDRVLRKREEIGEHLKWLGNPPTKLYPGQLPLFPVIYRLEVTFDADPSLPAPMADPIIWDSQLPRRAGQYRKLDNYRLNDFSQVTLDYQLHAYNKQQQNEQHAAQRLRWLSVLAVAVTALAVWWFYLVQHRERERQRQRAEAQSQIDRAERQLLQEELRRQEAERRQEDTERRLLEQQLATQAAERQALELKSQLYASISIMAGSYAHNIKNLLVRPNDLLRRCLEADQISNSQQQMLHEVQQTLGTVTERLQQILRTVHRDPSRSEMTRLDLAALVRDIHHTWNDLAREKWKLILTLDVPAKPVWIEGDLSHLQQAVENLVFNSRDATFEMRNHLRDAAHRAAELGSHDRRQALIAAAAWRGQVSLRVAWTEEGVLLEVRDNGIGMTDEVRRRCTETHFSTKRDNAVYEGISTGMGLGLSFVVVILEHHGAKLEIESQPLAGTIMRVRFPVSVDLSVRA